MEFRSLEQRDLPEVSRIAIASKATWGYGEDAMRVFSEELTLSNAILDGFYAAEVAIDRGEIVGYYSLVRHPDGAMELEHLFVAPGRLRGGIGATLLQRAIETVRSVGHPEIMLLSDPHAAGFYERFGAVKTGDHQSSIPGRTIPIYRIPLGGRTGASSPVDEG